MQFVAPSTHNITATSTAARGGYGGGSGRDLVSRNDTVRNTLPLQAAVVDTNITTASTAGKKTTTVTTATTATVTVVAAAAAARKEEQQERQKTASLRLVSKATTTATMNSTVAAIEKNPQREDRGKSAGSAGRKGEEEPPKEIAGLTREAAGAECTTRNLVQTTTATTAGMVVGMVLDSPLSEPGVKQVGVAAEVAIANQTAEKTDESTAAIPEEVAAAALGSGTMVKVAGVGDEGNPIAKAPVYGRWPAKLDSRWAEVEFMLCHEVLSEESLKYTREATGAGLVFMDKLEKKAQVCVFRWFLR